MATKTGSYLQEVSKEMKKVHWPPQKELVSNTVLTLVVSLALSLFIYGADNVVSGILEFMYR